MFVVLIVFCLSNTIKSQSRKVNLVESFKSVGIPSFNFTEPPLISLTEGNIYMATVSNDTKFVAVARSYARSFSGVTDIVLIKLKGLKETVIVDTQTMIRYGRPNGELLELSFNKNSQLIAKISDGMEGVSILTIDTEKASIIKDEYISDYAENIEEEADEPIDNSQKISDLKRVFPKKSNVLLNDLAFKLLSVDSAGSLGQGLMANDNSIFFLPHKNGNLRLIHNFTDPHQTDNINGVWGTSAVAFYILKDKKENYLFKYDIRLNKVTLLEKYPLHRHYTYINPYKLKNDETIITFEVEANRADTDDILKLFSYRNGQLYKNDEYPTLQEIKYLTDTDILLLYYLKNGKRCLDARYLGN
jgi:hypothetical protein